VEWSPGSDNNDPIMDYIVYYNTSFDEPDNFIEGARVPARLHTPVVQLQPWTNFTFHIVARNSLGTSERSPFTPAVCTTPQEKPYENPKEVCSVSRRADQLVITWQVCLSIDKGKKNLNPCFSCMLRWSFLNWLCSTLSTTSLVTVHCVIILAKHTSKLKWPHFSLTC